MLNCLISFLCGMVLGVLIHKYVKISLKVPVKSSQEKFSNIINDNSVVQTDKFPNGSKLDCIERLLNKIRNSESLPIDISPVLMRSLKTIADTKDWDKKLDEEAINNLYKIYNRC